MQAVKGISLWSFSFTTAWPSPLLQRTLMATSITCPLIFHSHTGAVNLRCNRYIDTQASCVITRGTMSAQLPMPLHSSGFQLTWADPSANHTGLLSTSRMKRIMLLGWCSSWWEGCPHHHHTSSPTIPPHPNFYPPPPVLTGTSVAVIYHLLSGHWRAKQGCMRLTPLLQ